MAGEAGEAAAAAADPRRAGARPRAAPGCQRRAGPGRSFRLPLLITCCWRCPDWLRGKAGSGKNEWEAGGLLFGMGEPGKIAEMAFLEWEQTLAVFITEGFREQTQLSGEALGVSQHN